jgi:hypothetical protein
MWVEVLEDAAGLAQYVPAWEALAAAALEPNVFYEPWMVLPALEAFGAGLKLRLVLVLVTDPKRPFGPPLLSGFFPLERRRGYKGLPVSYLTLWRHLYCFLCTPLVRADCARETLEAFLKWLAADRGGCPLLELARITGDGPFHFLLLDSFNESHRLTQVEECYTRALFRPAQRDADAYLQAALAGKRRKELKRQENRLREIGRLEYRTLEPRDDVAVWLEDFLRLEASGWKGLEGGALAMKEADRAFFWKAAGEAFRRGRLMMLGLFLDSRPIALKCNFLAEPGSFAFKIAFDEAYARYSPGVHLELANMQLVLDHPGLHWMDSCARPAHFMINRLWMERRTVQTLLLATGRRFGDLAVSVIPLLRWLKRMLAHPKPRAARGPTSSDPRIAMIFLESSHPTQAPSRESKPQEFLDLDAEVFRSDFDVKPFLCRHRLTDHPLFALPRLIELSRALPTEQVEYNAGDLAVNQNPDLTPQTGLSVEETIRRIEDCRSWMVLKNVETDPDYRDLLHACLAGVERLNHPRARGICKREAFIFISSPGSVTPYHMDPECNFLLQIRGWKQVSMFDPTDRSLVTEEQLERFYSGAHRNMEFRDEYQQKATVFQLRSGEALHFPVTVPHWVKNGDAVSISFSITFQTRATERRATLYAINYSLRQRGYHPRPIGCSRFRDVLKYNGYRILRRMKRLFKGPVSA